MSRVTITLMTRWLLALLVAVFVASGVHDADAQAFKKKTTKSAPAAKKSSAKKSSVKKSSAKKSSAKKSSAKKKQAKAAELSDDEDEDSGRKSKKAKIAPEDEDDYVLIEDDEDE